VSTIYSTPRGNTYDPMPVELWRWDGTGAVGRLETSEEIEVTWADRDAGTTTIDTPLNDLSRLLLDDKGSVLVVVTLNGKRHVSTVVESEATADEDARRDVRVQATTASAWSLLDGQRIPPVPDRPLSQQESAEEYVLTGPVETVVKTLVRIGAERLGHPIAVIEDRGLGPTVTVRSRMDTTADLVKEALAGTGYRLSLDAWLPGDERIGDLSLTRPTIIADVVAYRDRPGLVLSGVSEDLESWSLKRTRATQTRVIVGDKGEGTEQRFVSVGAEDPDLSPWARREGYTSTSSEDETPAEVGAAELAEAAATAEMDATAAPSQAWEFGEDGEYPRQYDVGDWCTVSLPEVGDVREVITEVTAKLTPVSLTVTPKVGTPDTKSRDLYALVTDLSKRVDRQRRGR
jgi:hypothetical protein